MQRHSDAGIYFCDTGEIRSSAAAEEYDWFLEKYDIRWIPTVLHIKNGMELSRYEYPNYEYRQEGDAGVGSQAAGDFLQWFDNEQKG